MEISTIVPSLTQVIKPVEKEVHETFGSYVKCYDGEKDPSETEKCNAVSNMYYDLVTDFYEYGWGTSFHFCPRNVAESFEHSMAKYEYRLALKLGLKSGMKCLDVGCGVGGPGRNIVRFSGASVVGLNYNKYQVDRCEFHSRRVGLDHLCKYVQGDFDDMEFTDNSFDGAFAVEATCHSATKRVYTEVFRVLKPGARFAFYEWILTDKYDKSNLEHVKIKTDILVGNGLPDLQTAPEVVSTLKNIGFRILEAEDVSNSGSLPWYTSLQGRWTVSEFRSTPFGMFITHCFLWVLEMFKLSPPGSVQVHDLLVKGAQDLVKGGKQGIFSPSFLLVVEKP